MQNADARAAMIGGTRQMIAEDSFSALVALLINCKAVPRNVMAETLQNLSDQLIAKARGQLETEWALYPAEIFDRARSLTAKAAELRTEPLGTVEAPGQ
jgi:hypothetical protein